MSTRSRIRKSVSFSQDPEDQRLLEAVNRRLDRGDLASFTELCKVALERYLQAGPSGAVDPSASDPSALHQQLERLQGGQDDLAERLQAITHRLDALLDGYSGASRGGDERPVEAADEAATRDEAQIVSTAIDHIAPFLEDF